MRPDGVKCMDQKSVTILILWVDPGGWKSKWSTRGNAKTKIQTSLGGLLVLSSTGLVSLLLSGEIFVPPLNGRYRNSILLSVLHIILFVAETTNLNLSYSVTLLQPRSLRILGGVKWTSRVAQYLHLLQPLVDYTVYLATLRLRSHFPFLQHPIGLLKSGQWLVLILPYIDPVGLTLVAALPLSNSLVGGSGGLGHRNLGRH